MRGVFRVEQFADGNEQAAAVTHLSSFGHEALTPNTKHNPKP